MASLVKEKENISTVNKVEQDKKHFACSCLVLAVILPFAVYLSEFFHFLEKPLFSLVYSGNLNLMFFEITSAVYIFALVFIYHLQIHKKLGLSVLEHKSDKLSWKNKAILYFMTLIPILIIDSFLHFQLKIIYELGKNVSKMTALGNGMGYLSMLAKLLCIVYMIFLIEKAIPVLRPQWPQYIPYGGIAAMLTFGIGEIIFNKSIFIWLYAFLFLYYGVIYKISGKRFGVTYLIAVIMYIL